MYVTTGSHTIHVCCQLSTCTDQTHTTLLQLHALRVSTNQPGLGAQHQDGVCCKAEAAAARENFSLNNCGNACGALHNVSDARMQGQLQLC